VHIQTKFLVLNKPAELGEEIEGWRVSWVGGWDKGWVFFYVMVLKTEPVTSGAVGTI
jgi:hypothetical protein